MASIMEAVTLVRTSLFRETGGEGEDDEGWAMVRWRDRWQMDRQTDRQEGRG